MAVGGALFRNGVHYSGGRRRGILRGPRLDGRFGTHSLYIFGLILGAAGGLFHVVRQLTRDPARRLMSMAPDIFERTAARVTRTILAVGFSGAIVAFAWRGWPAGFGFALGAIASWFNFRWLKGFVGGLGPGGNPALRRVSSPFVT